VLSTAREPLVRCVAGLAYHRDPVKTNHLEGWVAAFTDDGTFTD
jgi:hypothetical protein